MRRYYVIHVHVGPPREETRSEPFACQESAEKALLDWRWKASENACDKRCHVAAEVIPRRKP